MQAYSLTINLPPDLESHYDVLRLKLLILLTNNASQYIIAEEYGKGGKHHLQIGYTAKYQTTSNETKKFRALYRKLGLTFEKKEDTKRTFHHVPHDNAKYLIGYCQKENQTFLTNLNKAELLLAFRYYKEEKAKRLLSLQAKLTSPSNKLLTLNAISLAFIAYVKDKPERIETLHRDAYNLDRELFHEFYPTIRNKVSYTTRCRLKLGILFDHARDEIPLDNNNIFL